MASCPDCNDGAEIDLCLTCETNWRTVYVIYLWCDDDSEVAIKVVDSLIKAKGMCDGVLSLRYEPFDVE